MRHPARAALLATLLAAGCAGEPARGNSAVYAAWANKRSNVEVTATGKVVRLLGIREGRSGAHEGFLVRVSAGPDRPLVLRVEDNVDLTGPIPLAVGDDVEVRGAYVYDARGGIVHYTHRDPRGRHPAGYVRVHGKYFN